MSSTTKKLVIQFGNKVTPTVFAHLCTINTSRDFTITASSTEATEPNCEDPDAPGFVLRSVDTLSADINGAGTMDTLSFATARDLMLSGESFPVRVLLDLTKTKGGGYFEGNYVMTSLGLSKEGKGYVESSIALSSDGEVKWVAATA